MRAAHTSLDPGQIGDIVLNCASDWLQTTSSLVIVADPDGRLVPLASRGAAGEMAGVAADVTRWMLAHDGVFAAADLRGDPRVSGPCGAVLGLPLRSRGLMIGALLVLEADAAAARPELGPTATALLVEALEGPAMALDNAVRLRRSEALSVTDDLTQLYNSRYLNQVLRREAKRSSRSRRPLSLLFLDMDSFKGVNDTHGHLMGSRALVEAGGVIRETARETDVVARFGGDEFAVVLPDTGTEGAVALATRVRTRLADHVFLAESGLHVRLTASIGVATLPDVARSAEDLLKAADVAMYRVKGSGKNGLFVARRQTGAL
jgi:diguanylate cyclase (GGDEF)-like protein